MVDVRRRLLRCLLLLCDLCDIVAPEPAGILDFVEDDGVQGPVAQCAASASSVTDLSEPAEPPNSRSSAAIECLDLASCLRALLLCHYPARFRAETRR